jgi:hypothetical protein
MRVLVVHNAYQHKGGEDTVMAAEVDLLRSRDHQVELFSRCNDDLAIKAKVAIALDTFWSASVAADFEAKLKAYARKLCFCATVWCAKTVWVSCLGAARLVVVTVGPKCKALYWLAW